MTENVHWVPFEELAHATGHGGGTSFSSMLLTFGDMFERIDGEYVVLLAEGWDTCDARDCVFRCCALYRRNSQ